MTKSDYQELLRHNVCTVVFRKKDGSNRTMRCTLQHDTVNEMGLTPTSGGDSGPDNQVRCVDVEKAAWRSFNTESVVSFTFHVDLFVG